MVLVAHPYNNLVKGSINLTAVLDDELSKEPRQFCKFLMVSMETLHRDNVHKRNNVELVRTNSIQLDCFTYVRLLLFLEATR